MPDDLPASPESPPQRTTDGSIRWSPPSAAELQALMPGYTIEKLLGRGGMGAVYKGVQTNLDRTVAIKILPPGMELEDPSFAERFRNEARLMAKLMDPTVVGVFDFGSTIGGQLYIAMEYVDGTDVSQMIRAQRKLPPEHALAIAAHVCDALTAAHRLGIVHRDIKPANVLINQQGQVKVADFGLAKIDDPGSNGLTKTGYALGTPDFLAPEALMLGTDVDGRADLYAVGVMLYQMLTGNIPRGAFKPACVLVPGLDPRFDSIILKAMQHDREERHQSSTELRRDLDVIMTVPMEQVKAAAAPKSSVPAAAAAPGQTLVPQRSAAKPAAKAAVTPAREKVPVRQAPAKKASSAGMVAGLLAVLAGIGALFWFVLKPAAPEIPPNPFLGADVSDSAKPGGAAPKPPNPFLTADEVPAANAPPVPAWLVAARKQGGKVRFYGTGPNGTTEKGRAEEFKDVVEVALRSEGWLVRRANGETHGVAWGKGATPFGPFNVSRISHGGTTSMRLSDDGSLRNVWGGGSQHRKDLAHKDSFAVTSISDHLMTLGADGEILIAMRWSGAKMSPPADLFRGARAFTGLGKCYVVAKPGQPVTSWEVWEKKRTEFPAEIRDVVDVQAAIDHVILLTASGKVFVTDEFGKPMNKTFGRVPAKLGPAIAVRTGSGMAAAQMTDGTWVAWGDSTELIEQTKKIGPALDVGYNNQPGKSVFMLWVEG